MLKPLNDLLKANCAWKWSQQCSAVFQKVKKLLMEAPVLAHYDPTLPIRLAGDALAYGIGAVLSHKFPDGSERPIAYVSRTLSKAEGNYAQLEKEALSLLFGVHKFNQYIWA